MTNIDDKHQPDPKFLSRLEWQLMTEYRKQQRGLFPRSFLSSRWGWTRAAALILLSALAGMAGLRAAQGWERSIQYELALAGAEADARVAELRLEAAVAFEKERKSAFNAGIVDKTALAWARLEVAQTEHELARSRLRIEEMAASGQEVNDSLYASVVDGRDFVSERIELETELARRRFELAMAMATNIEGRVKAGLAGPDANASAKADIVLAEQEVERLKGRSDLRRAYLAGELDAQEMISRERLSEVRRRIETAQAELEARGTWLRRFERNFKAGLAPQWEVLRAKYEHERVEADLRLARLEEQLLVERDGR